MAKPLVGQEDRPDLTVSTEGASGSSPRDLGTILGSSAASAQKTEETKMVVEKMTLKDTGKEVVKDHKDTKDIKDTKDHKEPKDTKDNKDTKDHKDPKDTKDQKDTKDHKDPKEHKDQKDVKDHKEIKEGIKEHIKDTLETLPQAPTPGDPAKHATVPPDELTQLINRVSGLEKAVAELKK